MINKNLIFLLVITDTHPIIKLNQVHVNAVTQGYVPRNIDIERSPKNILVSSFLGERSHLKPILDVATVLIERPQHLTPKNSSKLINIHKDDDDYRVLVHLMRLATEAYNLANNLNKPVVGFIASMQMMDPKSYKSDPMSGCNISLENESFLRGLGVL
ncbi:unnamed protein product [Rhizophagus irregularis]|nr:unnamed protein product [Rhizophagus irregularis]